MNNVLLFLVVPCVLGFVFVQAQWGASPYGGQYGAAPYGQYGAYGGGGYGDQYNQVLAGRYLQSQQTGFLGLTSGELFGALLTCFAIYYLTNGTGKMTG